MVSYLAILPLVVMVATFALVLREPVDTAGMVVLALAAAFFVLSAIMFTGLGTKTVARFIHDSSEENTRYDSRIVSTGVGMILLGAGIMAARHWLVRPCGFLENMNIPYSPSVRKRIAIMV